MRRYFHNAVESDQAHMALALFPINQLYQVEEVARPLGADDRLRMRQLQSRPIPDKLRNYLEEIQLLV